MAVSRIQLTESDLKKKKKELEELNSDLKKKIKNLDDTKDNLMGMWTGDAAKAFKAAYEKDEQAYDKFIDLVTKYVGALESIMKVYEKGEKTNVETAKKRSYK